MRIGIIGSGNVGGTLGSRWAKNGHNVTFSSRNPGSDEMNKLLETAGPNARAALVADTVADSDILVLTLPWAAARTVLESAGGLSGKILIDAINALKPKLDGLELPNTTSVAEQIASWVPGAHVVKAFNTVGFNVMADTKFPAGPAVMFYCGDNAPAKRTVSQLITELGFDAVDAGPLTQARLLEPLAQLWISLAYMQGQGRDIAFQFMKR